MLITWLAPVLPQMAEAAGSFLGRPIGHWDDAAAPLLSEAAEQGLLPRYDQCLGLYAELASGAVKA